MLGSCWWSEFMFVLSFLVFWRGGGERWDMETIKREWEERREECWDLGRGYCFLFLAPLLTFLHCQHLHNLHITVTNSTTRSSIKRTSEFMFMFWLEFLHIYVLAWSDNSVECTVFTLTRPSRPHSAVISARQCPATYCSFPLHFWPETFGPNLERLSFCFYWGYIALQLFVGLQPPGHKFWKQWTLQDMEI